ncbi:MAG: ABC transporter ATP-binding protein [Methanomassiliicoccales archaeon]|nr:MAG: ABC transporter ATP-binding protein [Methanomassiliicoccales archaeon]
MMIETRGLTKNFNGFCAVDRIDLTVKKGDIFGFLGPNGAGKTTTIRMLTTILSPTSGTASVCGHDIISESIEVRRLIGLMPESPGFYENMSALSILQFYAEFYGIPKNERKKKSAELLEIMGLGDFMKKKIKTYSHGMRKRVALAQALINDPELLILDEPTGGLDPQGSYSFRQMIRGLRDRGMTVFLSSHILPEVQQLCNRVGIINHGRIVAVDTIENLANRIVARGKRNIFVTGEGITAPMLDEVARLQGIMGIQPYETGINFVADSQFDLAPEINRILVTGGARVRSIYLSEPTLEDIFLSLTGDEERG